MANKGITQLQVATTLTGTEAVPLVQNGVTKQTTAQEIANLAVSGSINISNDVTTTAQLYPVFTNITTGQTADLYTSTPELLYTPSSGQLVAPVVFASNGLFVNSATVSESYTVTAGNNAMSAGPITVASGAVVTVVNGVWAVVGSESGGGGNLPQPYGVAGDVLVSTGPTTTPDWEVLNGGSF
jgi:hypothetical protein